MLRGWAVLGLLVSSFAVAPGVCAAAQDADPWSESGTASYYRSSHHFFRTSSGEVYNENAMTAAHPTLPVGTMLRVTSNDNGRSVVVRVNDRSAHSNIRRGRVIDLSYAAARRLGIHGLGDVTLTEIPANDVAANDAEANEPVEVAEAPDTSAPVTPRHVHHRRHHIAAAQAQH